VLEKISLNNDSAMTQWDDFIKSHPEGSPFQLGCWLRTIQDTYSFKPLLYIFRNEDGTISSAFCFFRIKSLLTGTRIVSIPFSDHCALLCSDPGQQNELLAEIIEEHRHRVNYIEIRADLRNGCGLVCHNYYKRHVLELSPNPSMVMKNIDKRTIQYCIRKGQRSGVDIREENCQFGMDEFYRLNKLTRKKHGIPSQPKKFFENMLRHVISNGHASMKLAFYESRVVAAGLFFKFKDTVHYKYNASDPGYLSKATPNHLLTWTAIEQACLEGYRFFDFGRTAPDNVGLMRYKEMWGAKAMDLPYYYYPRVKGATSREGSGLSYQIYTRVWRSLPDLVVEFIGPKIYKHTA
jgi:serine/alanine adding enzyme